MLFGFLYSVMQTETTAQAIYMSMNFTADLLRILW